MAEAWTVIRTANGINVIDENGLPVCTRVGLDDAKLIASAPRLAEQVRILREALTKVTVGLQQANEGYSDDNFGDEIRAGLSALEATKEGA